MGSTRSAAEKSANASTVLGHKALQGMAELNKKMDALHAQLDAQGKTLSAIRDKKGFLF